MVQSKVSRSTLRNKKKDTSGNRILTLVGLWLLLITLLGVLFVLLLYKPFFQISSIEVEGTHVIHSHDIGIDVQELVSQKKFWFIPLDSWVTLPNKKIKDDLFQKFDRIQNVDIEVQSFDKLVITIQEWEPAFLWCNIGEDVTQRECSFMDEMGHVFSKAPYFSPGVYPMFVTPQSSLDAVLGENKIDPDILKQVLVIYSLIEKHNSTIEMVTFGDALDIIFTLQKLNGVPLSRTELRISRSMVPEIIEQNLLLLLKHTSFQEKFFTQPETLEYVDLRFDGKLLFKFRELL